MFYKKVLCYMAMVASLAACSISNSGTREITDLAGDKVMISSNPSRVVARTANSTSFMVGMGLQDKIVGTMDAIANSSWCKKYMSNIADIPSYSSKPTVESLYEANADLVLLADPTICRDLRSKGITAVTYKQYNAQEIVDSVKLMGEIFNKKDYADKWLSYYENTLSSINEIVKDIPYEQRPAVYYVYGQANKGLYRSGGGDTIETAMIELSGGRNVLRNFEAKTKFNAEEVLATNPEHVFIGGVYQNLFIDQIKSEEVWKDITAVKSNNIHHIPLGFIPWDLYGVELPLLLKYICHTIYPNYNFNIIEETISFNKEFYNVELTETEVSYMINGLNEQGERFF